MTVTMVMIAISSRDTGRRGQWSPLAGPSAVLGTIGPSAVLGTIYTSFIQCLNPSDDAQTFIPISQAETLRLRKANGFGQEQ